MNDFQSQMIALLENAQIIRGEGDTVMLYGKQFKNISGSLIVYMDSASKDLALSHKFLYLPSFSDEDRLLFADVTYTVHEYSNGVDVYGYVKRADGATDKITLATIMARSRKNEKGNYGLLFDDIVKDLKPLFPEVDISIPIQSLGKAAHIEIGKRDKFYSAGIYVVSEINDEIISKLKLAAVNYAKIDRNSIGAITDGYDFVIWTEQYSTGMLNEEKMDYAHFIGKLVQNLRLVF